MSPKKRFKRHPARSTLLLTERDHRVFLALLEHRFLSIGQIMEITETGSLRSMQARLRKLFDAGYIDRPPAQLQGRALHGNAPMLYALGNKGVEHLAANENLPIKSRGRWTDKNRAVTAYHLSHTKDVATVMLGFARATKDWPQTQILPTDRILNPTGSAKDPLSIETNIHWSGTRHQIHVRPDGLIGVEFGYLPAGKNQTFFAIEVDRGTEPVVRHTVKASSIKRKFLAYASARHRHLFRDRYGIHAPRVLMVTTSWDRVRTMQDCYRDHLAPTVPAGFFLFTTLKTFEDPRLSVLTSAVEDANGSAITLAPALPRAA